MLMNYLCLCVKQKTAYEMRISDWSSDVCSSDLNAPMEIRSEQACFGGTMGCYSHASTSTGTQMRFAVFMPPQARSAPVPALYFLAVLTCTEETFMIKAGAQRLAAEYGLALVACATKIGRAHV